MDHTRLRRRLDAQQVVCRWRSTRFGRQGSGITLTSRRSQTIPRSTDDLSHVCVWIDHREAKLFGIGLAPATQVNIVDHEAQHHIHRKANQIGLGTDPIDKPFLVAIAAALGPATAILIAGPGRAKTNLQSYLKERAPKISEHVWGIEPMDHPGSGGLVVAAHKYFFAADRMHV